MVTSILLSAFIATAPAGATGSSCDTGAFTSSLLGDLDHALELMQPDPGLDGQLIADGGIVEIDCSQPIAAGACGARRSVVEETERHEWLRERRGVGVWYGDGSSYHALSDEDRVSWLEQSTTPGQRPPTPDELNRSSCIEWVMTHVEAYYNAIGERETWERIEAIVRSEKLTGTALARELQAVGWTSVYLNADGDYQGSTEDDGEHAYSRRVVDRDGTYYGVPVDESIVGWEADPAQLESLERQPFFVYVARGGLHVTAGVDGQINELARGEGPDGQVIYQDPLRDIIDIYADDVHDGGPEGRQKAMHMWGSGLMLVPPSPGSTRATKG